MKVVALLSGGKDSCYAMMEAVAQGHEIVALANLHPSPDAEIEELDSFMFQSIGYRTVRLIAECMQLPLITRVISGQALAQGLDYQPTLGDEVEDLTALLHDVQERFPKVEGVCSGAIFSNYQRTRVENVCSRLKLTSLAYLWRRDQKELLAEMIDAGVEAVLVKVASIGLVPSKHLGKSLMELQPFFHTLHEKYQFHVCGEGGEYETITLDCPLFKRRIVIDSSSVVLHSDDMFAPVGYLNIEECHLEDKQISDTKPEKEVFHESLPLSKNDIKTSDETKRGTLAISPFECVVEFKPFKNHMYCSGVSLPNIALSLKDEVRTNFDHIKGALVKLNMAMEDIVFVHLFVNSMSDFQAINEEYCTYFGLNPASRSCVQVPLTCGRRVLVDVYAVKESGFLKNMADSSRQVLHVQSISKWAPTSIGPYSQANTVNETLILLAGQIGLVPESMKIIEGGLIAELEQIMKNIVRVLDPLISNLHHLVCGIVYLAPKIGTTHSTEDHEALDRLLRQSIQTNSGENDKFSSGYDSDESDDEIDSELEISKMATNVPMLYVVVERIPRNAAIEVEAVALTHAAQRYLHPEYTVLAFISGKIHLRGYCAKIKRALCLFSCTLAFDSWRTSGVSEASLRIGLQLFQSKLADSLVDARLPKMSTLHVRLFYCSDIVQEHQLMSAFNSLFQSEIPMVTYIPVLEILPDGFLGAHVVSQDLNKACTELWLHKNKD